MIVVISTINAAVNVDILKAAAIVQFGTNFIDCNITDYGASVSVYLNNAVVNQQSIWDGLVAAQDPVLLIVDKATIKPDGVDTATITVHALKATAAAVTITITATSPAGTVTAQDDPITLVNGVGTETITSLDPCTIVVTVKNAANRSTDSLTITAR